MKVRGGIRIGRRWESWPSAQLEFTPDTIVLRYRGEHVLRKGEVDEVAFLRGAFTTEIRIAHRAEFADSPLRFFPLFSKDAFAYATSDGVTRGHVLNLDRAGRWNWEDAGHRDTV